MIIKKLKINKYKSIKSPISLDFLDVNIFIGQNNCGKSNILDAIQIALDKNLDKSNLFYPKADIEIELKINQQKYILNFQNNKRKINPFNNLNDLNKKIKRLN